MAWLLTVPPPLQAAWSDPQAATQKPAPDTICVTFGKPLDDMSAIVYTYGMIIRRTDVFIKWLKNLTDSNARFRVYQRIERLANGNPGDVKPIGEGCSEMRIDYGPGYRVYFKDTGKEIIFLLCGGEKSNQTKDIENAKKLAKEL
ncbi:MAG: type II toxin-antitoxin system RelE/ParE family toxin [Treponema sp.]|jgi:putative addiction module killer protein|nr:type II toxin-antitoxin system RelE/ParE family toxin [Treponema sp.]